MFSGIRFGAHFEVAFFPRLLGYIVYTCRLDDAPLYSIIDLSLNLIYTVDPAMTMQSFF